MIRHKILDMAEGRAQEFAHEDNDCTVWAIATASGMPYSAAHRLLQQHGRIDGNRFPTGQFLALMGNRLCNYTVRSIAVPFVATLNQVAKTYPHGRYIVRTKRHVLALIDGVVHDTAPCGARKRVSRIWELRPI